MDMQTTSKVLPNERKQSERRRKWMEAAVSIAQDVANHHDWEEVIKSSKAKVDPCKYFLISKGVYSRNSVIFRLTLKRGVLLVPDLESFLPSV